MDSNHRFLIAQAFRRNNFRGKKPASQTPAYLALPSFTIRLSCGVLRKTKRTGQDWLPAVLCDGSRNRFLRLSSVSRHTADPRSLSRCLRFLCLYVSALAAGRHQQKDRAGSRLRNVSRSFRFRSRSRHSLNTCVSRRSLPSLRLSRHRNSLSLLPRPKPLQSGTIVY